MVCILCPMGCILEVVAKSDIKGEYYVTGNKCTRGSEYAREEIINPTRVVTTTVKIKNASESRLPVRTVHGIPKNKILECINILNKLNLEAPLEMGDIIVTNILSTGVNVVASKDMKRIKYE